MLEYTNETRRAITGAGLAQLRRRMSAAERACVAADIIDGRLILQGLTAKSIAGLVGVNLGYVDRALQLTPEQRAEVCRGDRPLVAPRTGAPNAGRMSDEMLVEMVRRVGIDRALHAVIVAEETEDATAANSAAS